MTFHTADYVLAAATLVAAILGLFGGFSGALGFCAGVVAAALVGRFGFAVIGAYVTTRWLAGLALLAATLLAFGLARVIVKRVVKGLLAQPADAIFGSLVAALTGAALALAAMFAAKHLGGVEFASSAYALVAEFLGID